MRIRFYMPAMFLLVVALAGAQVAAHAPVVPKAAPSAQATGGPGWVVQDKPVARVNGVALTDRDLLREMLTIFPYARQHNGFPKGLEPEIRRGALEMIIFEELVYQEAQRRKLTVPPARLARAEADFRKQFPSQDAYQQFLQTELKGSRAALREKIRRSLLIEALLKAELEDRAAVSVAEARKYYDQNSKRYEHGELFSIQTISIMPPKGAGADVVKEARKRAEEALRLAKATGSYREFGLLAERISDDDWHVNLGDRKQVDAAQLPPPLVAAARKMKPGEVSGLLQFGTNYTLFRLNGYVPAGKSGFVEVQQRLQNELQKAKYDGLRAEFHKKLRKNAKVEVL
jgi:peptidyl-prolyl cis-trans isomerase C